MKSLAHFLPQQSEVQDHRHPSYQRVRFIEELKLRWHLLLGESLSQECWPLWIRQHTLWIGTPSPLIAQELGFYADDLLKKMTVHLGVTAEQLCLNLKFMAMSETQWNTLDRNKDHHKSDTQHLKQKKTESPHLSDQEKLMGQILKSLREELD